MLPTRDAESVHLRRGSAIHPRSLSIAQAAALPAAETACSAYWAARHWTECINAQARNRGLQQLPVRGLPKVKAVALLFALAHNLMAMLRQAPQLLGIGTGTSAMPARVA